jgi:hypothetical protein
VVQFRAPYANLHNKSYANVWQSEDSPGDFDHMRISALRFRPFSKGVVFASDQLYWPESESEIKISKYMMTSVMVGVPSFGPDLVKASSAVHTIVRNWLSFYETHKTQVAQGRVVPFGPLNMPNHKIEGQTHTFAYLRNNVDPNLVAERGRIYIMNATDADSIFLRVRGPSGVRAYFAEVFNRSLDRESRGIRVNVDSSGLTTLNLVVPQGGMVLLSPLRRSTTPVSPAPSAEPDEIIEETKPDFDPVWFGMAPLQ